MKRVGFKPRTKPMRIGNRCHPKPEPAEREPRVAGPEFRYGTVQLAALFRPIPKHEYIRSAALMKAYRTIACQHCGKRDGTVCGAHSNWHPHHKGGAIKADDNRCASLCSTCHYDIDQGADLFIAAKKALWWRAHVLTVQLLAQTNRWPAGVPIPDLTNPW